MIRVLLASNFTDTLIVTVEHDELADDLEGWELVADFDAYGQAVEVWTLAPAYRAVVDAVEGL